MNRENRKGVGKKTNKCCQNQVGKNVAYLERILNNMDKQNEGNKMFS